MALRDILELGPVRDLTDVCEREAKVGGNLAQVLTECVAFANRAYPVDRGWRWASSGGPVVYVDLNPRADNAADVSLECSHNGRVGHVKHACKRGDLALATRERSANVRYLLVGQHSLVGIGALPNVRRPDPGRNRRAPLGRVSLSPKRRRLFRHMRGRMSTPAVRCGNLGTRFIGQSEARSTLAAVRQVGQSSPRCTELRDGLALAPLSILVGIVATVEHEQAWLFAARSERLTPPRIDVSGGTACSTGSVLCKARTRIVLGRKSDVPKLVRQRIEKSVHNPSHCRDSGAPIGRRGGV